MHPDASIRNRRRTLSAWIAPGLTVIMGVLVLGSPSWGVDDPPATDPKKPPVQDKETEDNKTEARQFAAQGTDALRDADNDPHRAVDAAIAFSHALNLYDQLGDTDSVCEMQANIFWCKKRMNLDTLKDYIAHKGVRAQHDFQAAEKVFNTTVPASESVGYLARANKFRDDHPDNHLEIAIRFSEIIERFPDSDESKQATQVFTKEQSAYLAQVSKEREKEKADLAAQLAQAHRTRFQEPPSVVAGSQNPIPDKAAQSDAMVTIKKVYKDDFAHATKDTRKRSLSRKLLSEAEKSKDDVAVYYVLLEESERLAMEAEDYEQILTTIEHLGAAFTGYDQIAAKKGAMTKMKNKPTAVHILKLMDDPNDKPANTLVGKFFCYNIGRWDLGLPMLSSGSDEELRKVADMELSKPKDAAEIKATADAWYELGKKSSGSDHVSAWSRAQTWYVAALPKLSGVTKNLIDKRMDEIDAVLPPLITDYDALTPKQWDKLKGTTLVVEARVDRSDGRIELKQGERIRVVPHPTDEWSWNCIDMDIQCTAKGWSPPSRYGNSSGFSNFGERFRQGALTVKIGAGDEIAPGIISGVGHLWLQPHNNWGGLGTGQIRVKLVPVSDDE